jgi:hypothetical protein
MFMKVNLLMKDMKSHLAQLLLKIHESTRSDMEFEYSDPTGMPGSGFGYSWLLTNLFEGQSTRGSNKILWTVTNSQCSFTLIKE